MMIQAAPRQFLPVDFVLSDWATIEPYCQQLVDRSLDSKEALLTWLQDWGELEAVISEDACWRQIKMTCDTTNAELEAAFTYFCMELEPKLKPYTNRLQQKLVATPFVKDLDKQQYFPFLRGVEMSLQLFRESNVPIEAELNILAQQYGTIAAKMTVTVKDQEYTLQQAGKFLEQADRTLREEVYTKVQQRRLQDQDQLNDLFDQLLTKRHQVALNAGFENYRDYKFKALGRFDYTPEDCFAFHEAVKTQILPLQERLLTFRKQQLGLDELRPFDTAAVPEGVLPLHPFKDGEALLQKSIQVFDAVRPYFGDCLRTMKAMQRLDLDSRKGKAPGGYNCPLAETGVPFIFMNAAGTVGDVITMMHEGGHAIHSFLAHPLPLTAFKEYPMEIAELASMSMELFTMEHWHHFFDSEPECLRARQEELERVIDVLPWIATIDKFQHWLYTHPGHSVTERTTAWERIFMEFNPTSINWDGLEVYRTNLWQKQLHLFEVPFYYIEYGIAQLGAIAMWRQYKQNKEQTLDNYSKALSLGYTVTLPELYATAGIRFGFSSEYIAELRSFMEEELTAVGM